MSPRFGLITVALVVALKIAWAPAADAQASPTPTVKIGMLENMFQGASALKLRGMSTVFNHFVEEYTGLKGELKIVTTADEMRQQLSNGDLQVGAFHGYEFAWMKLKDPTLQPLMLVNAPPGCLKTVVVVAKECACDSVAQLRGKSIAVPVGTREHSRLFLSRRCRNCGRSVKEHFAQEQIPPTIEDALDDVVDGISTAAVVDQASLQTYAKRKPGRYGKLKQVEQSEVFPPSVIAYSQGKLNDATLQKFRLGMTTAHKTAQGGMMMNLMKITTFEPVPANFDQIMAESVKNFPPPH